MHRNLLEGLESRLLFAQTYDFASLTGLGLAGHSWKYAADYSVTSNVIDDFAGSGTASVSVKRQGTGTPEKLKVSLSSGSGKVGLIVQNDSKGLSLLEVNNGFGEGSIKLKLGKTRLAPKTLTIGQKYTDTGTFSGTFSGEIDDTTISGKVTGKTSITTKLTGAANVSTPAGDFSAIKGNFTVKLTGTLKVKIHGISVEVDFSENLPETFWAVDGVGIVKSQSTLSTSLSFLGQKASLKAQVTGNLKSYTAPATAMVAKSSIGNNRDLIGLLSEQLIP